MAAIERAIPIFALYGEAPRDYDERTLHVETIAFRSARYEWKIAPHLHRSLHQILLVTQGRSTVLIESGTMAYGSAVLVVMPAGAVHGFQFERGTQGYVVSITDDLKREIAQRTPEIDALFEDPAVIALAAEDRRTVDAARGFEMFEREFADVAPARSLALEGQLKVLLAGVLRLSESRCVARSRKDQRRDLVARFRSLIEQHFRSGWAVSDYAETLNVSESVLRATCLGVAEQSPIQMIHARIVREAKRELLYTSNAVSEIGYALGFADPAYFTRFFSRRTGVTPSLFRARRP